MSYPPFHWANTDPVPMVVSTAEFADLFPGEGDYVEFKQGLGITALREAVTAFSNCLLYTSPRARHRVR